MKTETFKIVFEKLEEFSSEQENSEDLVADVEKMVADLEEISELRRLVMETTEPEQELYTTT